MAAADEHLNRLQDELDDLLDVLADAETRWRGPIAGVAIDHRRSAINLVHYVALRRTDLRDLTWRLAERGLSSLERGAGHVQATVQSVSAAVATMRGCDWHPSSWPPVRMTQAAELLETNAAALFGPTQGGSARSMVTLPTEAATDTALVEGLVAAGMTIATIDCAHGDRKAWKAMAATVRAAAASRGRRCLVAMDLAGPELRTGPLEPGPKVLRLRPVRNARGQVVTAGRAWLTSTRKPAPAPEPGIVTLPVDKGWLARRREGDHLRVRDTRGCKRTLRVTSAARGGFVVTTEKTVYLGTGTKLKVAGAKDSTAIGELPAADQAIRLRAGDVLRLTRDCTPVAVDELQTPHIGCTLPQIIDAASTGDRVWFDDSAIGGTVLSTGADELQISIDHPPSGIVKLRGGTRIHVPGMTLTAPALTEQDRTDLKTVVAIADIVIRSAHEPADVVALFTELDRLGANEIGVVLTIDTPGTIENLTQLILTAMRRHRVGVMIAHDAEIRGLCEAAHLPVADPDITGRMAGEQHRAASPAPDPAACRPRAKAR